MEERTLFAQDTWHSKKFVNALKGDPINGFAEIPVPIGASRRTLREENKDQAIEWFGHMIAAQFDFRSNPLCTVLVPGHEVTSATAVRRSRLWGSLLALHTKVEVCKPWAGVWWKTPQVSARQGGSRDPSILRQQLVVGSMTHKDERVVIVDDVFTSGGHLRAVAAELEAAGIAVLCAICAARTVEDEPDQPFQWRRHPLAY